MRKRESMRVGVCKEGGEAIMHVCVCVPLCISQIVG